jgi:hypothetical protein
VSASTHHAPPPLPGGVAYATPAVTAYLGPPRGLGKMPGVRATTMGEALARAGLDVENLPPLETLAPGPKQKVMRTFSEALGVPCVSCHDEVDFKADTRRKRVARRMWDEITRVLTMRDGEPVYCDSCHGQALFHLDRRDPEVTAAYMANFMVGRLRRADGRTHDCTTCHGESPDFQLLSEWKTVAAPDIVHEMAPGVLVPEWPIDGPRDPVDCGKDAENCPLEAYMSRLIAPLAARLQYRSQLESALERVADFAPESERFVAAAKAAAAAAKSADASAIRAACTNCHRAFKAMWRASSRSRSRAAK